MLGETSLPFIHASTHCWWFVAGVSGITEPCWVCCFLTVPVLLLQWVVRLPLPRAGQDRGWQLDILPSSSAHRKQERAVGGKSREAGGGGDGQRQGTGHFGCITLVHGSAKNLSFRRKHVLMVLLHCACFDICAKHICDLKPNGAPFLLTLDQ